MGSQFGLKFSNIVLVLFSQFGIVSVQYRRQRILIHFSELSGIQMSHYESEVHDETRQDDETKIIKLLSFWCNSQEASYKTVVYTELYILHEPTGSF